MVKRQHKALCIVLTLVLTLTTFFAFSLTAMAASGDTIYVNADNGWTTLYCYMWKGSGGSGNENASWPGVKMTSVGNNIYSYRLTDDYTSVIFNTGSGGSQTDDLTYTGNGGDGKIYSLKNESWTQYVEATEGDATQATQAATQPVTGSGTTVYLKNSAGWSSPNCYMWNGSGGSGNENASWPGKAMTKVSDDVWMYSADKTFANCIFNGGGTQTGNLTAQNGYIYDNTANTWEVYDTSELQVKSFKADPEKDIYKGMEVTLTANAVSTQGGSVNYKFSVTNASGTTTVIRDFTASNTAKWTPATAGTYKITFDFNDTIGTTNSRELSLTVLDDASLAKPVIKKVTPSDGYIKTGNACTVSVTAGGGKTGTNLLFYKYVVEDPNGGLNTAYYTLNNTYSFTPYSEGTYKVTVYVQASDNATVNKSYTLQATGGNIPTTAEATAYTVQPTTVQPTTVQPTTVQPTTVQPTTVQPTTVQPTTVQPTTVEPTTVQPTTAEPTTVQPTTEEGAVFGDANGDGVVNIKDATYLQMALLHFKGYKAELAICDFNGDGKLSIKDVTAIQRYCLLKY